MKLISEIHQKTKTLHEKTESQAFLIRYKDPKILTPIDHYRHLVQLYAIYTAIEKKLKSEVFTCDYDLSEFQSLRCRSDAIKKDLQYWNQYVPKSLLTKAQDLTPSTQDYVAYIHALSDPIAILSEFLIRILGDLHGGQKIKQYVQAMAEQKNLASEESVSFYYFPEKTLATFSRWLGTQNFNDETVETIVQYINDSFQRHITMYQALEANRSEYQTTPKLLSQYYSTCSSIFNNKKIATVVGIAATAYTIYLSMS